MGCDIHFYVEKKGPEGWKLVRPSDQSDEYGFKYKTFYHNRNYRLFAVLAGVRNGKGFAGCDTGDPITPISRPRGLPKDCSDAILAEHRDWGSDAHSASWLTLAELQDFNWNRGTVTRGVISEEQYAALKNGTLPDMWCGWSSGPNIVIIPFRQYDELTEAQRNDRTFLMANWRTNEFHPAREDEPIRIQVQAEWARTLRQECGSFLNKTIPTLSALGPADEVRCVFWFDN